MFASNVKGSIELEDGDSKVTVTIKKLSARALDQAREARITQATRRAREVGADLIASMRSAQTPPVTTPTAEQLREARYDLYDRDVVLRAGVVAWTHATPLAVGLEDLDEPSAVKLSQAILDLSLPPLDVKTEEDRQGKS
jgi:hypothetical protein